jgi:tight adherence protein C
MTVLLVIMFATAGSVATVTYMLLGQRNDRVAVQGALRHIEHFEGGETDMRDNTLAVPLAQRVFVPMLGRGVGLIHRFTPADYVAKIRQKLVLAGEPGAEQVDRFLATRLLILAALPLAFVMAFWVLHMHGKMAWAVVGLCGMVSIMGPSATLNRKIAERRKKIQTTLPDVLDLLTISVEAGLGFEQALDRAVDAVPGPLTEELSRMLGEMRAGARRSDALRAFDARTAVPEVHSFTLAILQADTFGVSITRVLRSQADEMRIRRRQMAQEQAMKAPVKMLIPMVFCIFPSLFTVVLGPAVLNIFENFK